MAELPFDMLRGGRLDFDEQDEYERRMAEQGYLTPQQGMAQTLPINPLADIPASMPEDQRAQLAAERNYTMRAAGFMPDGKGGFVDPQRDIAGSAMVRLQMMQERDKRQTEAIANSMLFKAGDTLADAGRMFLSPLFWLKGQDQSQYDPSDRLKTGYNLRFNEMNALRDANYQKFSNSRNQRLAAAVTFENTRANQRIQMMSPFEKELQSFAVGEGLLDMYNDPEQREALTQQYRVRKGQAIQYGDRVVDRQTHTFVTGRAEKFAQQVSGYKQALQGYNRLKASLEASDAFGDIAAIFGFMKMLDPNSVVREGEFAVASSAGGLFERMKIIMQQADDGQRLTPAMRKEILALSNELVETYNDAYADKRSNYEKEFKRYQYSDDEIEELLGGKPNIEIPKTLNNVNYAVPDETFDGLGIDPAALLKGPEGYKSKTSNPETPTYMMRPNK